MNRLTSRKFLMAVAIIITDLIFVITGKAVDVETIVSLHAIAAAWITGETVLDRKSIELNTQFLRQVVTEQANALAQFFDEATKVDGDLGVDSFAESSDLFDNG